jgi:hypothetical protein
MVAEDAVKGFSLLRRLGLEECVAIFIPSAAAVAQARTS